MRCGADRECRLAPIRDQRPRGLVSMPYCVFVRLVEVAPDQNNLSTKAPRPSYLDRVGLRIDEDGYRNSMRSPRVRHGLAEVPTRSNDDAVLLIDFAAGDELAHGEPRASTLERSNRVDRLHLHDRRVFDSRGESARLELRCVEKNRIHQ
jgi:hypothetical protein